MNPVPIVCCIWVVVPVTRGSALATVVETPEIPLFVIDILSTPPVANLIVSAAGNVIPVLLSVPVNAGAETDPSTPEIPVVPLMFKAIIKE